MFAYTSSYEGILERQRDPLNSVNNPGFEAAGANMAPAIDAMEKVHDEATQNSGSGDSNFSNLSALENETDDFGRLLLQHQKDAKRLNNALRGGKEQAFRRARPRPGVAERLEREERERLTNAQNHQQTSNNGSPASDEVEPPVTVPREWGRRARKQTDWLKKIVEPSEDSNIDDVNGHEAIYEHQTAFTGDLDWQDVTGKPLHSIEQTPPSIRRHQTADTPSSLNHMNTTLKPTFDFDEHEFTSTSFLASTAAPTRYHRKIDELARQELEELEIKAVTTRTLDQIDSRSPNAVLRSRSNSKLRDRANADRLRSPLMSPEKSSSPSRIPVRRQHLINNKENAPPNGYAQAGPKHVVAPAIAADENGTQPVGVEKTGLGIDRRPLHGRNDSMNLLKKLARVSSLSPSPARPKSAPVDAKDGEGVEDEDDEIHLEVNGDGGKEQHEIHSDIAPHPEQKDEESGPKHESNDAKPKDFVSWNPEKAVFVENNARTLAKEAENVVAEIPTPHDEDGQPLEITKSLENEVQIEAIIDGLAKVKPDYPRSALEAIVREAKLERETQQFGESTIQSLEDIVHPDLDPTITFDFDAAAADPEEENIDDGQPLTQAQKDRRQEDLAMEAMNKHLRTARTSIKDANRGLRRVENRIETTEEPSLSIWKPTPPSAIVIKRRQPDHVYGHDDEVMLCETCGCHQRSVWKSLYLEFRSLFYTYDETPRILHQYLPISIRIRLTRLGTYIFLWWIWYIIESTLWAFYGTPLQYAPFVHKDDNVAFFPFVIPTLILRPFRPLWIPVREALEAHYHAYFGDPEDMWSNGYKRWIPDVNGKPKHVSPAEFDSLWNIRYDRLVEQRRLRRLAASQLLSVTKTVVTHLARATRSFVDAVDEAEYMWNDEILT